MYKLNRNDECPCGSGKKYKKCCMGNENKERNIERACRLSNSKEEFLACLNQKLQEYTFKINLDYIRGEKIENVIRTIQIPGDFTLYDFHLIIQRVFDWDNDHMYSFFMSNKVWDRSNEYSGNPDGEHYPEDSFRGVSKSAADTEIKDLELKLNNEFKYLFDYGDEIIHTIKLTEVNLVDNQKKYPLIIEKIGENIEQYPNYDDDDDDWDDGDGVEENEFEEENEK